MWLNLLHKYPLMDEVNSGASGSGTVSAGNKQVTQNNAEVQPNNVEAGGNGNVAMGVSSNHILQFPRQPRRDDGKWVAIGSLIGALLGKVVSSSIMDKVKDAENKWRDINAKLDEKGRDLWAKADPEWQKMLEAETNLENHGDWNKDNRDFEYDYANALNECNDDIHAKLCQYVNCGYKPDYYGIATRTISTAEAAAAKECRELKKELNRYNSKGCCDIGIRLATAKVMSVVGTVSKLRESERQKQWEVNSKLLFDGAELFHKHRRDRMQDAVTFDTKYGAVQEALYKARNYNYFKLVELGGEFLAAAGRNYGWLASSLRQTAEKDTSGLANLGAMIAVVAAMFFCGKGTNFCGEDDGCGGSSGGDVREEGGHQNLFGDSTGSVI